MADRILSALLWGLVVGLMLAVVRPMEWYRYRALGQLTACESNLRNIGTALEMYSMDHEGRFPRSLVGLTPNYLKKVPTCPACGSDTYSEGLADLSRPDAYTVMCTGSSHRRAGLRENFPQYSATQGVVSQ